MSGSEYSPQCTHKVEIFSQSKDMTEQKISRDIWYLYFAASRHISFSNWSFVSRQARIQQRKSNIHSSPRDILPSCHFIKWPPPAYQLIALTEIVVRVFIHRDIKCKSKIIGLLGPAETLLDLLYGQIQI